MTNERFQRGHVIRYPYRWSYAADDEEVMPKDRPVCVVVAFKSQGGRTKFGLVAISERPGKEGWMSVELPLREVLKIGLSQTRPAFAHVAEVNFDHLPNSYSLNPNAPVLGKVSKKFLQRLSRAITDNLAARRLAMVTRK